MSHLFRIFVIVFFLISVSAFAAEDVAPALVDEKVLLQNFLIKKFENPNLSVRVRPNSTDAFEVYIAHEFIGIIYKDAEDPSNISYSFQMAILDFDLEK